MYFLFRFFFGLAVWVRFVDPLGFLLDSFWGAPGCVLGYLGISWARLVAICRGILEPSTSLLSPLSFFSLLSLLLALAIVTSGRRSARSD